MPRKLRASISENSRVEDYQSALMAMVATDENGAHFLHLETMVLDIMINKANTSLGSRGEAVCVNCRDDTTGLKCGR